MKSSYSICYGTSLETEQPPLETMPQEARRPSEIGKILLEGLNALAAIDTTPDVIGIKIDQAARTGAKRGRRSKGHSESATGYTYTPSAEVRQKFARLSTDLISAMGQAAEHEEAYGKTI